MAMIAPPASTRSVPGAPDLVLKSGHFRPDDLVLFVRDIKVAKWHSFRCDHPTRCGVRGDPDRCSLWSTHPSNEPDGDGCADHHAIDARSVLGTVQCSSLRSARACARHSGLDGACAQITSWPLRDGRRCDGAKLDRSCPLTTVPSGVNLFSSSVLTAPLRERSLRAER